LQLVELVVQLPDVVVEGDAVAGDDPGGLEVLGLVAVGGAWVVEAVGHRDAVHRVTCRAC
jgi:hypothetical protein